MKKYFGKLCALSRERAGYTQVTAGYKIGCSDRQIANWESGKFLSIHVAVDLANAYNDPPLVLAYLKLVEPGQDYLPDYSDRCLGCVARFNGHLGNAA